MELKGVQRSISCNLSEFIPPPLLCACVYVWVSAHYKFVKVKQLALYDVSRGAVEVNEALNSDVFTKFWKMI